jgi:catechol 1,2-dioxygenase
MADEERLVEATDRLLAEIRAAIRDLRIDEHEIHAAAEFLNRVGQAGEFADMLDIFFGVTSVEATLGVPGGTTPNLAGPYYREGAPERTDGRLYDGDCPAGQTPLLLHGTVSDAETGEPLAGAELDLWQPDGSGIYDREGYHLRGIVRTDQDGRYSCRTVRPEGYEIPAKGPTTEFLERTGRTNWRPAHIHLKLRHHGVELLQTQFFLAGARHLDADPVEAVRPDLIVDVTDAADGNGKEMQFDMRVPARPRATRSAPATHAATA